MDALKPIQIGIVGGGMVGLLAGLVLAHRLDGRAEVTVFDAQDYPVHDRLPQPSFDDRSTALSYSTLEVLAHYELLHLIEDACPIDIIHVSNKGRFGSTVLGAKEMGWDSLGAVVENKRLGNRLLVAARVSPLILRAPAEIVSLAFREEGAVLQAKTGETYQLDCVVVADGLHSDLAQSLGLRESKKAYTASALVANVATARPHQGCAFERFGPEGPMALLPLSNLAGHNRSALVWTGPTEQLEQLRALAEPDFCDALQAHFGYRLGRIERVGTRALYPLVMMHRVEQVRSRLVVLGNAAHTLHPVAGQGFNLSVRDINALADVLSACVEANDFTMTQLHKYQARRDIDQRRTLFASDLLPALFQKTGMVAEGRDLLLRLMDFVPPARRRFVQIAAGTLGEHEYV